MTRSERPRPRVFWIAMFLLAAGYLASRVILLTSLPVFVDEATLIHDSRHAAASLTSESASEGKWLPPVVIALFSLLPGGVLATARLASVFAGLVALCACVSANAELFGEREGLLAGFVYTILPLSLFYDRLALADEYVVPFGAACLYFSILLVRSQRRAVSGLLALATCGAVLAKTSGALVLSFPLLVAVILVERNRRQDYLRRALPAMVGGLAIMALSFLLGIGTGQVLDKGTLSLQELPAVLGTNSQFTLDLRGLLPPPLALITSLALVFWTGFGMRHPAKAELLLVAVAAACVVPYLLLARTWFPRYLVLTGVPIAMLLARTISASTALLPSRPSPTGRWLHPAVLLGVLMIATVPAIRLDYGIIRRPEDAPLPAFIRWQYVQEWSSGYGLPELSSFLRREAENSPINVVRFSINGPPYQGLDVYLGDSPSLHLYTVDYHDVRAPEQIAVLTRQGRTFFVSNPDREIQDGVVASRYLGDAMLVWSYLKPDSTSTLQVWEIAHPANGLPTPDPHP